MWNLPSHLHHQVLHKGHSQVKCIEFLKLALNHEGRLAFCAHSNGNVFKIHCTFHALTIQSNTRHRFLLDEDGGGHILRGSALGSSLTLDHNAFSCSQYKGYMYSIIDPRKSQLVTAANPLSMTPLLFRLHM